LIIGYQAVEFPVHKWGGDHEISRGPIASNRDIPYNRHAQKRLYVRVVGLEFQRIPEKDEEIDLVVNDLGPDLLVASQRFAGEIEESGCILPTRPGPVSYLPCVTRAIFLSCSMGIFL